MPEIVLDLPEFHPKQKMVWTSKATQILLGGDTRAGKSFFIKKAYIRFAAEIPGLVLDIFRLNWDDVIKNYMKGEHSFPVMMAKWIDAGLCTTTQTSWTLWNGSTCNLYHCSDDNVLMKHQGNPTHVRTIEEACQIPEGRIRSLVGWMDMSEEMKARIPEKWSGCFPRLYFPTNPVGPSAGYFARHFVDARPPYEIEQDGAFTKQHIPFELDDNKSVNPAIVRARIKEAFPDPAMQKALLERDWHARTGLFFTEYDEDRHVVPDFRIPDYWYKYRVFDWGTSEPAYCAWIAISDGYPFKCPNDGKERWFPRGALIIYNEWYICDDQYADPKLRRFDRGRNMSNVDMARGIVERSDIRELQVITLTDSKPFQGVGGQIIDGTQEGPAKTFQDNKVPLTKADTTRPAGWSAMRDRLIGVALPESVLDKFGNPVKIALLYIFESCRFARAYIPQLPRHPTKLNDAAEEGEPTHVCDSIRYACMAHNNAVIKTYMPPIDVQTNRILAQMTKRKQTVSNLAPGLKLG